MDTAKQILEALQGQHGLTDKAIASLVGSTQPTIWRIRTGAAQDCSASLYIKLVQARLRLLKVGTSDTASEARQEAA